MLRDLTKVSLCGLVRCYVMHMCVSATTSSPPALRNLSVHTAGTSSLTYLTTCTPQSHQNTATHTAHHIIFWRRVPITATSSQGSAVTRTRIPSPLSSPPNLELVTVYLHTRGPFSQVTFTTSRRNPATLPEDSSTCGACTRTSPRIALSRTRNTLLL